MAPVETLKRRALSAYHCPLRRLRLEAGIARSVELSNLSGVPRNRISQMEIGEELPKGHEVTALIEVLNCEPGDLFEQRTNEDATEGE